MKKSPTKSFSIGLYKETIGITKADIIEMEESIKRDIKLNKTVKKLVKEYNSEDIKDCVEKMYCMIPKKRKELKNNGPKIFEILNSMK